MELSLIAPTCITISDSETSNSNESQSAWTLTGVMIVTAFFILVALIVGVPRYLRIYKKR